MEEVDPWAILTILGAIVIPFVVYYLSVGQNVKVARDERRSNAENNMSGVLSSVIRTLGWYVTIDASPGPKLERGSMDQKELMALTDVDRSLEAFDTELEKNSLELDARDLQVCTSFRKEAEECRKLRRSAQVQRQDWHMAMENIRGYPQSEHVPIHLINFKDGHWSMAEDYAQRSKNYFDTAKVEAGFLLERWKSRRNSIDER